MVQAVLLLNLAGEEEISVWPCYGPRRVERQALCPGLGVAVEFHEYCIFGTARAMTTDKRVEMRTISVSARSFE